MRGGAWVAVCLRLHISLQPEGVHKPNPLRRHPTCRFMCCQVISKYSSSFAGRWHARHRVSEDTGPAGGKGYSRLSIHSLLTPDLTVQVGISSRCFQGSATAHKAKSDAHHSAVADKGQALEF